MLEQLSEKELWKEYKSTKNNQIKEILTCKYLNLVKYIVKKFINNNITTHEDLFSYGLEGLVDAIEKYEIHKNTKFTTYAYRRIIGAIYDGIRENDVMPRSFRIKEKKYNILKQKLGRTPSQAEIQKYLGLKEKQVKEFTRLLEYKYISLDADEEEHQRSLKDIIPDSDKSHPENLYLKKEIEQQTADAVKKLSRVSRKIIILYYYENLTLKEIGECIGVSEARACQLRQKAERELKEKIKHLEVYV
jgi:RNA polymerase sigma factor FliA